MIFRADKADQARESAARLAGFMIVVDGAQQVSTPK
jgi:hypothetical protein